MGGLAAVNNVAMTLGPQVYLHDPAFCSSVYVPSRAVVGSNDESMLNVLRKSHTVFHGDNTISSFQQQCTRVLISPHPCRLLLFSVFLFLVLDYHCNGCDDPIFKPSTNGRGAQAMCLASSVEGMLETQPPAEAPTQAPGQNPVGTWT